MTKKKESISINFIIPMHIYPFDVMVSINQSDIELGRKLDRYGTLPVDEIESCRYTGANCHGRYVMFSNHTSLIRIRKLPETPFDYGVLAHEITHTALTVLDTIGIKLEINTSDEAFTYLIQYLTENIYKQINKYY